MIKRISIISIAVLATLLIAGLASATPDDSSSSTSSTTSTTQVSTAAGSQTATGNETYEAGAAGQVTVDQSGASLSISNVAANADWTPEVEMASGREVEVKFVNGAERIDFQAEIEEGIVKTRVRTRTLDSSTDDSSDDDNQALTAPTTAALQFNAGEAGTVQIRAANGSLELVSATPHAGWTVADIEIEGTREINVEFHNGTTEIEFKAELEDGMVKTRVRTEMNDDSSNGSSGDADDPDDNSRKSDSGDDRSDHSDDRDDDSLDD
jgi:hypothetical protein